MKIIANLSITVLAKSAKIQSQFTGGFMQRFGIMPRLTFGARSTAIPFVSLIDFTAESLDSRVFMSAPSHSYIASDGSVKQSGVNQWPLEYDLSGDVVGRHEPERASRNYMADTEFTDLVSQWVISGGATVTTQPGSLGHTAAITHGSSTKTALYSEQAAAFIAADADSGTSQSWVDVVRKASLANASVLRWYVSRASGSLYFYGKTDSVPAGSVVASVFKKYNPGSSVDVTIAQVEAGANRTSPILNGSGENNSRSAMSAYIDEPRATGAIVTFSNGDTLNLTASNGRITIPVTALDWRARFITKLELQNNGN